jgi:hypothetical protein
MSGAFNVDISKTLTRLLLITERLGRSSITGYHKARLILTGPVRNAALVSREFAKQVGRERQFEWPKAELWSQAKQQYIGWWDAVFPRTVREQGKWLNALGSRVKSMSWGQVGEGALLMGEILSFYYMTKLIIVSSKKTLKTVRTIV